MSTISHSDPPEGMSQSSSIPPEDESRSTHLNTATGVSQFCLPADAQAELLRVIAAIHAEVDAFLAESDDDS